MMFRILQTIIMALGLASVASADVVKPALVEISANTQGTVNIEVRASIEALLTGINARFKNTQDAPTAEQYDALRVMPA
ncbi:MAG: HupE/UreJ family protein, partial [Gammaproteobacteria bacterium]